jgi:hypothetical protein
LKNAPGLTWRQKGDGWEAIWRARKDLVKRGFRPKNQPLWEGLSRGRGCDDFRYLPAASGRNADLRPRRPSRLKYSTARYRPDPLLPDRPDSSYHKKRYAVRKNHDMLLKRIVGRHGTEEIGDINARLLLAWHKEWSHDGRRSRSRTPSSAICGRCSGSAHPA